MSRIFICHAPADSEAVEAWMGKAVVAGARQEDVEAERDAPEGIGRAGVVMLYASQDSLDDTERLTSVRLAACYAVPVDFALAPDVRTDDVRLADIDATIVDSAEAASLATVSSALGAAGEDRQPRIFISYSRRDLDRARALRRWRSVPVGFESFSTWQTFSPARTGSRGCMRILTMLMR